MCSVTFCIGFNSRTPGGVRRKIANAKPFTLWVSIHAPREGCDVLGLVSLWMDLSFNSRTPGGVRRRTLPPERFQRRFNSRTPGGVRQPHIDIEVRETGFQFTHPGRGATERDTNDKQS